MNSLTHSLVTLGKHQIDNLRRLVSGRGLLQPGFVAQTVGAEEVELAERFLAATGEQRWEDPAAVAETVGGYESAFAAAVGVPCARSFRSGREALSACLQALDLPAGTEVIVPGYTCVVVPNSIRFAGLRPVFADIELETFGPRADSIAGRLRPHTGAIVLHHLYGLVCRDYEAILDLAAARNIPVIEDCAHALGARFRDRAVGSRGTMAFFSTEQSKVLCTVTGGMAVTGDPDLGTRLAAIQAHTPFPEAAWTRRALRTLLLLHATGVDPRRWWRGDLHNLRHGRDAIRSTSPGEEQGERPDDYGRRLPLPLAALGRLQLGKLAALNERRREAARHWAQWCASRGLASGRVIDGSEPVFLRFPVLVEPARKADLRWARRELGFTPGTWFRGTLHPVQHDLPDCPRAHEAVARCINLPTLL